MDGRWMDGWTVVGWLTGWLAGNIDRRWMGGRLMERRIASSLVLCMNSINNC